MVRVQKQIGHTETQSIKIQNYKPIIDQIDCVFAKRYGFTDYDIKYHMRRESEKES